MTRRLALLALLLFLVCPASEATPRIASYTSGGRTIHVDVYAPRTRSRPVAVLVLHGSGGILGNASWMSDYAASLAELGYTVYVPHYYDRTGDIAVGDMGVMRRSFKTWLSAVRDGVTFALRDAHAKRVGVLGLSLGGFLSTALGCTDSRVAAIVEMCGGLPPSMPLDISRMPPLLVMHGARDRVVPVEAAYRLAAALQLAGRPFEVKIYDEQGHGFTGSDAQDARRRTLRFFSTRLR